MTKPTYLCNIVSYHLNFAVLDQISSLDRRKGESVDQHNWQGRCLDYCHP